MCTRPRSGMANLHNLGSPAFSLSVPPQSTYQKSSWQLHFNPHSFLVPILSPLKSLPVPPAWQPVRSMPHKNLCGDGRSLRRTFPIEASTEHSTKSKGSMWSTTKNLPVAELRTMINSLSLESSASMALLDCSFLCWPSLKSSVWFTTFQHSLGDRVLLSLFEKGDLSNSHYV